MGDALEPMPSMQPPIQGEFLDAAEAERTGRFARLWHSIGDAWLNNCIRVGLVIDTGREELAERSAQNTPRENLRDNATIGMAIGGQIYERLRGPEIVGVSLALHTYGAVLRQQIEVRGIDASGAAAALAAAGATVASVWIQQTLIGRNIIRTSELFSESFKTMNALWPEKMEDLAAAMPHEENPLMEGWTMAGMGNTPMIVAAKLTNPELTGKELRKIEKRITRRGSLAAGVTPGAILGLVSLAPALPEEIDSVSVREPAIKAANILVEYGGNPIVISGVLMLFSGHKLYKHRRNKRLAAERLANRPDPICLEAPILA